MNGTDNQSGLPSQSPNPGDSGQNPQNNKVNPMSPNFMGPQGSPTNEPSSSPTPPSPNPNPVTPGSTPPPTPPTPPSPTPQTPPSSPAPSAPPTPPSPPTPPAPPKPPTPPTPPSPTTGGSSVPPPPSREVDIRTMQSDQESIKQTGGLAAKPKTVTTGQTVAPATDKKTNTTGDSRKKALLMGLAVILILAAAGVAAYFILPNFFSQSDEGNVLAPVNDTGDTGTPEEPTGPTGPAGLPTPSSSAEDNYQSYLLSDTDEEEVMVDPPTVGATKEAVAAVSGSSGAVSEFYVTGADGELLTTQEFWASVFPQTDSAGLEENFSGYVYHSGDMSWPGYIFKLSSDVTDKEGTKALISAEFESSANIENLYVEDIAGPEGASFADSITLSSGSTARYKLYNDTQGVSFVYGWQGDYLVLGTHFDGFKAVVDSVGEEEVEQTEGGGSGPGLLD